MVEIEKLKELDKSGIKDKLFEKRVSKNDIAPEELLHFWDDEGQRLTARIFSKEPSNPHVLYFPAEYESEETLKRLADGFASINFTFIAFEYPEFGLSQGEFSFLTIFDKASLFFDSVKEWLKETKRNGGLVIMGRSIGSAIAINEALKREKELLCLVIESGFSSGRQFFERSGIPSNLLPEEPIFANRKKMAQFKKSVLFIHSSRDEIQSLPEVEWLVAESRSKATQFQIAPSGTRRELAEAVGGIYFEILEQYINLRRGVRPSRKRKRG